MPPLPNYPLNKGNLSFLGYIYIVFAIILLWITPLATSADASAFCIEIGSALGTLRQCQPGWDSPFIGIGAPGYLTRGRRITLPITIQPRRLPGVITPDLGSSPQAQVTAAVYPSILYHHETPTALTYSLNVASANLVGSVPLLGTGDVSTSPLTFTITVMCYVEIAMTATLSAIIAFPDKPTLGSLVAQADIYALCAFCNAPVSPTNPGKYPCLNGGVCADATKGCTCPQRFAHDLLGARCGFGFWFGGDVPELQQTSDSVQRVTTGILGSSSVSTSEVVDLPDPKRSQNGTFQPFSITISSEPISTSEVDLHTKDHGSTVEVPVKFPSSSSFGSGASPSEVDANAQSIASLDQGWSQSSLAIENLRARLEYLTPIPMDETVNPLIPRFCLYDTVDLHVVHQFYRSGQSIELYGPSSGVSFEVTNLQVPINALYPSARLWYVNPLSQGAPPTGGAVSYKVPLIHDTPGLHVFVYREERLVRAALRFFLLPVDDARCIAKRNLSIPISCEHGKLNEYGTCTCDEGYFGYRCDSGCASAATFDAPGQIIRVSPKDAPGYSRAQSCGWKLSPTIPASTSSSMAKLGSPGFGKNIDQTAFTGSYKILVKRMDLNPLDTLSIYYGDAPLESALIARFPGTTSSVIIFTPNEDQKNLVKQSLGYNSFTPQSTPPVFVQFTAESTYTHGQQIHTGFELLLVATGCPAGSYFEEQGDATLLCTPCPAGTFSSTEDSFECTPCEAHTYSSTSGAMVCTPCSSSRFQPEKGQTSCLSCHDYDYVAPCGPNPTPHQGVLFTGTILCGLLIVVGLIVVIEVYAARFTRTVFYLRFSFIVMVYLAYALVIASALVSFLPKQTYLCYIERGLLHMGLVLFASCALAKLFAIRALFCHKERDLAALSQFYFVRHLGSLVFFGGLPILVSLTASPMEAVDSAYPMCFAAYEREFSHFLFAVELLLHMGAFYLIYATGHAPVKYSHANGLKRILLASAIVTASEWIAPMTSRISGTRQTILLAIRILVTTAGFAYFFYELLLTATLERKGESKPNTALTDKNRPSLNSLNYDPRRREIAGRSADQPSQPASETKPKTRRHVTFADVGDTETDDADPFDGECHMADVSARMAANVKMLRAQTRAVQDESSKVVGSAAPSPSVPTIVAKQATTTSQLKIESYPQAYAPTNDTGPIIDTVPKTADSLRFIANHVDTNVEYSSTGPDSATLPHSKEDVGHIIASVFVHKHKTEDQPSSAYFKPEDDIERKIAQDDDVQLGVESQTKVHFDEYLKREYQSDLTQSQVLGVERPVSTQVVQKDARSSQLHLSTHSGILTTSLPQAKVDVDPSLAGTNQPIRQSALADNLESNSQGQFLAALGMTGTRDPSILAESGSFDFDPSHIHQHAQLPQWLSKLADKRRKATLIDSAREIGISRAILASMRGNSSRAARQAFSEKLWQQDTILHYLNMLDRVLGDCDTMLDTHRLMLQRTQDDIANASAIAAELCYEIEWEAFKLARQNQNGQATTLSIEEQLQRVEQQQLQPAFPDREMVPTSNPSADADADAIESEANKSATAVSNDIVQSEDGSSLTSIRVDAPNAIGSETDPSAVGVLHTLAPYARTLVQPQPLAHRQIHASADPLMKLYPHRSKGRHSSKSKKSTSTPNASESEDSYNSKEGGKGSTANGDVPIESQSVSSSQDSQINCGQSESQQNVTSSPYQHTVGGSLGTDATTALEASAGSSVGQGTDPQYLYPGLGEPLVSQSYTQLASMIPQASLQAEMYPQLPQLYGDLGSTALLRHLQSTAALSNLNWNLHAGVNQGGMLPTIQSTHMSLPLGMPLASLNGVTGAIDYAMLGAMIPMVSPLIIPPRSVAAASDGGQPSSASDVSSQIASSTISAPPASIPHGAQQSGSYVSPSWQQSHTYM